MLGHGVAGLEWAVAQVIGDWTPAPTVVCVLACKAVGYAREGLPLCDGEGNAVARAPPVYETNEGAWPEAGNRRWSSKAGRGAGEVVDRRGDCGSSTK